MSRLRERADNLLRRAAATDPTGFAAAHDALLWAVVTAGRDELGELVARLFDLPYLDLPVPIPVAAFRLWGLELPADPARASIAANGIALYCDPVEGASACAGLRGIAEPVRVSPASGPGCVRGAGPSP